MFGPPAYVLLLEAPELAGAVVARQAARGLRPEGNLVVDDFPVETFLEH